jgi:hypothetical protein
MDHAPEKLGIPRNENVGEYGNPLIFPSMEQQQHQKQSNGEEELRAYVVSMDSGMALAHARFATRMKGLPAWHKAFLARRHVELAYLTSDRRLWLSVQVGSLPHSVCACPEFRVVLGVDVDAELLARMARLNAEIFALWLDVQKAERVPPRMYERSEWTSDGVADRLALVRELIEQNCRVN